MNTLVKIIAYASTLPNIYGVNYFGYEQVKENNYSAHIEIITKHRKKYEGTYECQRGKKCEIDMGGKFSIELTSDEESYSLYVDYTGEEFLPLGCCSFSNWKPSIDFYKAGVNYTFTIYNLTTSNLVYIIPKPLARLDIEVKNKN